MHNKGERRLIDLAIIVPTLNEEHFVGRLLESIIKQTVVPKEIIIVDAFSQDNTIAEVKKRQKILNLRYFQIPRQTISCQRNFGVQKTTAAHLLFLDADMELKQVDVLEKYFAEVMVRQPDIAAADNLPNSKYWKDLIYFTAENFFIKLIKYFWPLATARNLYVKRSIFSQVGGFNESIPVGEDHELVQRITGIGGKLIFLRTAKLYTSVRRVKQEGRKRYALRMILFGLSILLRGYQKSKVKYEFGNFKG